MLALVDDVDARHVFGHGATHHTTHVAHRIGAKAVPEKKRRAFDRRHIHPGAIGFEQTGVATLHTIGGTVQIKQHGQARMQAVVPLQHVLAVFTQAVAGPAAIGVQIEHILVVVAVHVDAVTRTQMVRQKPVFKIFRLAGTAPLPVTYEFEADVL